jgi:hypothetical protein
MSPRKFVLVHDMARQRAVEAVRAAGAGLEVVIREPRKSREQEEKYHAQIGDIARQYTHVGRKWSDEDMKRLLVDAFKEDTKRDPDLGPLWLEMGDMRLVPAIGRDGFVALGDQTRRFPKKLASAFIEWLNAFGAENDIEWTDPHLRPQRRQKRAETVDAETGEILEHA